MFMPLGTEEAVQPRRFPLVTVTIATLIGLIFLVEWLIATTGRTGALHAFRTAFGLVPVALIGGQDNLMPVYLTWFTSMFVHVSLLHAGFNLIYLLAFGVKVEGRLGHIRYLVFFLLAGLAAAMIQVAIDSASPIPNVGASGAIASLLGGYLVLFPEGLVRIYLFAGPFTRIGRAPALVFIGIWFFSQFFSGVGSLGIVTVGGEAYWAHLGGFGIGLVLAWFYKKFLEQRK